MHYRLRRIITFPALLLNNIVWAFQRAFKGYSSRDWWSIDSHIANILSKALPEYVAKNAGVNINYIDIEDNSDEAFEKALATRNEEYLKYADFFARYADGGIWAKEEDAKKLNGVTIEEYEEAMDWLAKNFSGLWH